MNQHIISFNQFINEAIIMPDKIEDRVQLQSMEDAISFGEKHGFDVVEYDEFYNSLSEADKKTAPPRFDRFDKRGAPFFALFHPIRKKPMFVICDPYIFNRLPLADIMKDIIGHERIHGEQSRRKGDIDYSLPSPEDKELYFSNKEEIMAFAFTIATDIKNTSRNFDEAVDKFNSGRLPRNVMQLWDDIKKVCSEEVIKRYRKYIYLYLEKLFD